MSGAAWLVSMGYDLGWTTLLTALRLAPLVILVPIFGGPKLSPTIRLTALVCLVVGCFPPALASFGSDPLVAISQGASQLFFGLCCAAGALFIFEAARMAGALTDTALGRGSFGAADPLAAEGGGPQALLWSLLFVALFAATGGHLLLIFAVHESFSTFAVDEVLALQDLRALGVQSIRLSAAALTAGVALAMPALAVALVVDVCMGWLGRALPHLPVLFISMPLRMVLGWLVVAASLALGFDILLSLPGVAYSVSAGAVSP